MKLTLAYVTKPPYVLEDKDMVNPQMSSYIDAVSMPGGTTLTKIQLPRVKGELVQPQLGSYILVGRSDDWTNQMICIMKDPPATLIASLRSEKEGGSKNFHPGEIMKESEGGAFIYLDNQGNAQLSSGSVNEQIYFNAKSAKTTVQGLNVELNNGTTALPVKINLNQDGSLVISCLTDLITNQVKASIKIDSIGNITTNSLAGAVTISTNGQVSISGVAGVNINAVGNVNVNGNSITLGDISALRLVNETFQTLFNIHGHPGPGLPPATLMTDLNLTNKTKAS